jgi:hypothetical protein
MPGNMVLEVIMRNKLLTLIGLILGAIAILYPLLVVLQASLTTVDGLSLIHI